jgi:hypothetical protein
MPVNVHDAEPQRESGELIPDGTFVRLIAHIVPGGANLPSGDPAQDALDSGLFKQSETSDALGVEMDITVLWPERYAKRKIFGDSFWTISGGSVDSKGTSKGWSFTKTRMRSAINSCMGLDPADKSPRAVQIHTLNGFSELDGLEFFARLSAVPGGLDRQGTPYPDKNGIFHIVEPGEPEYAALVQRQEIEPQPANLRPRGRPATATAGAAAAPAVSGGWGTGPGGTPAPARTWGVPSAAEPAPPAAAAPTPVTGTAKPRWAGGA